MQYEHADISFSIPGFDFWPGSWLQYTPAVVSPPRGSDTAEDWYIFWSLAKRLGKAIDYAGKGLLPIDRAPSTDDVLTHRLKGARISLEDIRPHCHGHDFGLELGTVAAASPGNGAKFDVMPSDVATELDQFRARMDETGRTSRNGRRYDYLLITRRLRDLFNSTGVQLDSVRKRTPNNPAYLNSVDMEKLGVKAGDMVELITSHGRTLMFVARDDEVRPGVVSTTNGWGGLPGADADLFESGTCVNLMIDTNCNVEPINAMPHFSGVPVDIVPVRDHLESNTVGLLT